MDFEAWLALQRLQPGTLRVTPGDYVCRYTDRREYKAALRITEHFTGTLVSVANFGVVRVRVRHEGGEYDFTPAWVTGRGFCGHRVSPRGELTRGTMEAVQGFARAAILRAAREEYDRLSTLAAESVAGAEDRFDDVLIALTAPPKDGTSLDVALRASIVEQLAEHTDGVELLEVADPCSCIGCERRFRPGDRGPVRWFGSTAVCGDCLSPARRAA